MRLAARFSSRLSELFRALPRRFNRLAGFIDSFVVVILRPEELMEQARTAYNIAIRDYSNNGHIGQGLLPWEKLAVDKYARKKGSFLVLGCGGGRDAIALARMGFKVTAIDSLEEMLKAARENASREGVEIDLKPGDFANLSMPGAKFDYCILTDIMYSSIPSSRLRVKALSKIAAVLDEGGVLITHFFFGEKRRERLFGLRKLTARLVSGNTEYAPGDQIFSFGFAHIFSADSEITDEALRAGFAVKEISASFDAGEYAVLQKR
jgi:SAM-dependent methyltransferase